jgi:glutaredoxin
MPAIRTINWLYGWREASVGGVNGFNGRRGATDAVLYGADGSRESAAMVDLLNEMGVEFEYRSVNSDPAARREWEDLDGESIPMLRLGSNGIVRGLDRIKVQQLIGWVGC